MLRCMTVRKLSLVKTFCQFCHFSIYNSVRFVHNSFTLFFLFSFLLKLSPRHFYLAICAARGKSLIFKGFFLPSGVTKLAIGGAKMLSY